MEASPPITLQPMEALSVSRLPTGAQWRYEPKWDGFRCLARKEGDAVALRSKSGKPLERYFPDIVDMLRQVKAERFLLDGELVIEAEGGLSFAALQLRLHPAASRVAMLAKQSPASFILFDMLIDQDGMELQDESLARRRAALEKFYRRFCARHPHIALSPQTASLDEVRRWQKDLHGQLDGIIAKNAADAYAPGERQMQKYKAIRTADCVVGGFRYGSNSKLVGSLLLGLYDDQGLLHHVGFTSSIPASAKLALTKELEKLKKAPGFTGNAPGAPSRWSTERSTEWEPLAPKLIAEVAFDHVSDDRFRHGTKFLRFRPDKAPEQCKMDQLAQKAGKLLLH